MIVLDRVEKIFVSRDGDEVEALADVSLEARRNEFVCLVGPSGCGKSTLLRLVAGLIAPSGGTISIDGSRVTEPRADTGIVFQAPTLLPWASVLDNVLFPLDMMGRLDAVKSFLTLQPRLIDAKGPHGFTLHFHAQVGGKDAENVDQGSGLVDPALGAALQEINGRIDALTEIVQQQRAAITPEERPAVGEAALQHSVKKLSE